MLLGGNCCWAAPRLTIATALVDCRKRSLDGLLAIDAWCAQEGSSGSTAGTRMALHSHGAPSHARKCARAHTLGGKGVEAPRTTCQLSNRRGTVARGDHVSRD